MDCDNGNYLSSTIRRSLCGSAPCSVAKAKCDNQCFPGRHKEGCSKARCYVRTDNTIPASGSGFDSGFISVYNIGLHSTDGSKSGPTVVIPNFIFGCLDARERLSNLAKSANGMVGLGREPITLPKQLSSIFGGSFEKKFAICLPSTSKSNGVMFFGDSPYVFHPHYNTSKAVDVSTSFHFARLYPRTEVGSSAMPIGPPSPEYFLNITSILVDRKPISINPRLLQFHTNGKGAKISTVEPYTLLETTIFKSLVNAFEKGMVGSNVSKVSPVAPFTDCYATAHMSMSPLGLGVPDIAFEFDKNKDAQWDVFGLNSMVEVSHDVACLAFLDAGDKPVIVTSIVIGTHQLQDNLVQFDLASNRLAFTRPLLLADIECSNFKF